MLFRSKEICKAILKLYNNADLREECGRNGRRCIEENFDREKITKKFEDILKQYT